MKRWTALLLALGLVLGLLPGRTARAAEVYVLPVFETSDIHGYLVNTAYDNEANYQYRLAYIADKVDDVRQGDASRTVLLDGGDIYQGNVISNLQNGWPLAAGFDAMEYDAVGLGNHEFDWGIQLTTDPDGTMPDYTMNGTDYDCQIPILCCNLYYAGTTNRVDFTQDYVILEKTAVSASGATLPVRVAVVGYVNDYSSSIMTSQIAPYTIRSGVSRAETIARGLLNGGEADCAILLTHADASTVVGNLSSTTPFALVCGGHSHKSQTGTKNGVCYIQPTSQAAAYVCCELRFDGQGGVSAGGAKIETVSDQGAKLRDNASNKDELAADVLAVSHAALEGVQEALHAALGYITTSVTGSQIGNNPMSSTGGNWMTDLANRATGAKVSFTNSGGIRTSFYVNSGSRTVTKGDIYTIAPFNNRLYVYDLSYAELLSVLRYAVGSGSNLGLRMSGIDCYYSGSNVTALVEDGKCIYKNGTWSEGMATQTVRVSANEYIATSSGTPFYQWNNTGRFVDNEMIDNESFIRVLEAEGHGTGLLYVDPEAHMIRGSYTGELYVPEPPDPIDPPDPPDPPDPIEPPPTFSDVPEGAYYADAVAWAVQNGVTKGTGADQFSPGATCTRAQVVTFLWRAMGEPDVGDGFAVSFTDLSESAYYYRAVLWAVENGVTAGLSATRFGPNEPCTRAQVVTFLWRTENLPAPRSLQSAFTDVSESAYYYKAMCWAVENGITTGVSAVRFAPGAPCTRAQIVTFLYRDMGD